MKTLHNPIIIGVISSVIISGVIFIMFQTIISGPSMQSQTAGNVEIQNIQIRPTTIKVGDTFTVSATLVNNLQDPIYVHNDYFCGSRFFVIFDSHVTVDAKPMLCAIAGLVGKVDPSEKIITVAPTSLYAFRSITDGTANATIIFSYTGKNQTDPNGSYVGKTISKSFLFTISNQAAQTSNGSQHLTTFGNKSSSPMDPPILEVITGKPVTTTSEAKTQVGYDVKMPTYIPAGYQVQIMNADAHEKVITILVSPNHVSSQTTLAEFFNQQKGMLIYMEKNSPEFDVQTWFSSWVKGHSATIVSVNGIQGAVHGIVTGKGFSGETIESPAEIVFVKNNITYEIRGIVP